MARIFNGSTDYIDLGNDTSIDVSNTMTVGAWIKTASQPANTTIVNRGNNGASAHGWQFGPAAQTLVLTKYGKIQIGSPTLRISGNGIWQYIAVVVTATNVRFIKILSDGTFGAETVADSNAFNTGANAAIVSAQQNGGAPNLFFNGEIAWVGVNIGTALSDANIQVAAFNPTTTWFPSLLLPLNGSSSETDSTGLAPSVTLHGTTADPGNPSFVPPFAPLGSPAKQSSAAHGASQAVLLAARPHRL